MLSTRFLESPIKEKGIKSRLSLHFIGANTVYVCISFLWLLEQITTNCVENNHKLYGLKQQRFSLTVLEARCPKSRSWEDHGLSEGSKNTSLPLSASGGSWLLSVSSSHGLSLCLSTCVCLSPSSITTPVIGFSVPAPNLVWLHLESFQLITPLKTLY